MWPPFANKFLKNFQISQRGANKQHLKQCLTPCTVEKWRWGIFPIDQEPDFELFHKIIVPVYRLNYKFWWTKTWSPDNSIDSFKILFGLFFILDFYLPSQHSFSLTHSTTEENDRFLFLTMQFYIC